MPTRDYFAEMYVAGVLADEGWNVYFPRLDHGFDFIVTKSVGAQIIVRPVQVKGTYPTTGKTDKQVYGYTGSLTQTHPEMVLAVPFFETVARTTPKFIAYLPYGVLRAHPQKPNTYRVSPARFSGGSPHIRAHYSRFFDNRGIELMASLEWKNQVVGPSELDGTIEGDDAE